MIYIYVTMTKYKKMEVLAFQMKFFRQYTFIKEKIRAVNRNFSVYLIRLLHGMWPRENNYCIVLSTGLFLPQFNFNAKIIPAYAYAYIY